MIPGHLQCFVIPYLFCLCVCGLSVRVILRDVTMYSLTWAGLLFKLSLLAYRSPIERHKKATNQHSHLTAFDFFVGDVALLSLLIWRLVLWMKYLISDCFLGEDHLECMDEGGSLSSL